MVKRKSKKLTDSEKNNLTAVIGSKYLTCNSCEVEEVIVNNNISKVTCSKCVQKLVTPPETPQEKSDKPRGWHLKPYFEHNGNIYSKGKLITDSDQIKKLKRAAKKKEQNRNKSRESDPEERIEHASTSRKVRKGMGQVPNRE